MLTMWIKEEAGKGVMEEDATEDGIVVKKLAQQGREKQPWEGPLQEYLRRGQAPPPSYNRNGVRGGNWKPGMRNGSCLKTGQHFIFVIIYSLLPI